MKTHSEDCMDANDDTSVFKGKCICPNPEYNVTAHKFAFTFANSVCRMINDQVPAEFPGMPYARQCVLESLIKILEERV